MSKARPTTRVFDVELSVLYNASALKVRRFALFVKPGIKMLLNIPDIANLWLLAALVGGISPSSAPAQSRSNLQDDLASPARLDRLQHWRRSEGRHVYVCYTDAKKVRESRQTARYCDRILRSVCRNLHVVPPPFKIGVYLFPTGDAAIAHKRTVTMPYMRPREVRIYVSHEFAHVLGGYYFGGDSSPLLNEGLACYSQNAIRETSWKTLGIGGPEITTNTPLCALANPEIFDADGSYPHACSFVSYLIARHGIRKFKRLWRADAQNLDNMPAGISLENAVRSVYHTSLRSLERRWRFDVEPGSLPDFDRWDEQPFIRQEGSWQISLVAAIREQDMKIGEARAPSGLANLIHLFILAKRLDKKALNHWNSQTVGDSIEGVDGFAATDIATSRLLGRPLQPNELMFESKLGGRFEETILRVVHGHYEPRDTVTFTDLELPEPGKVIQPLKVETGKFGTKVKLLKMGYAGKGVLLFIVETINHGERRLIPVPANRACSVVSDEGRLLELNEQLPWFWGVDVLASGGASSHEFGGFLHSVCFREPPPTTRRVNFTYGLCEWVEEDRSPPMFFDRLPALSHSLSKRRR